MNRVARHVAEHPAFACFHARGVNSVAEQVAVVAHHDTAVASPAWTTTSHVGCLRCPVSTRLEYFSSTVTSSRWNRLCVICQECTAQRVEMGHRSACRPGRRASLWQHRSLRSSRAVAARDLLRCALPGRQGSPRQASDRTITVTSVRSIVGPIGNITVSLPSQVVCCQGSNPPFRRCDRDEASRRCARPDRRTGSG